MTVEIAGSGATALSERELQVVRLVAEGKTNLEIALDLYLSRHTVKTHLQRITHKTGIGGRSAIVAYCMREGLIR